MTDKEYKELSIKEFTKAARVYETDDAGVYRMCRKDYPDVLEELEKKYQLTIGIPSSDPERMYQTIKNLVSTDNLREIYQTRRQRMLEDKIDVATFFSQFIEKLK